MNQFNWKSVLLGIGIGIILTATASIIFLSGRDPMKELTEQQIIEQAEKYGMVRSSLLQDSTAAEPTGISNAGSGEESTGISNTGTTESK